MRLIKKVFPWIVFSFFFALVIIGFALKDKMNGYLSRMMKEQATPSITLAGVAFVDSLYNYSNNGLDYEATFLEFGAKGCSACKRMEAVMNEVRDFYPNKVNVVFMNILKPESQDMMKYYGIAAIPTQVLLDKNGKEFFRHTGYYSTENLMKQFTTKIK